MLIPDNQGIIKKREATVPDTRRLIGTRKTQLTSKYADKTFTLLGVKTFCIRLTC